MTTSQTSMNVNFSVNIVGAARATPLNCQLITTSGITPQVITNVTNVQICFTKSISRKHISTLAQTMAANVHILNVTVYKSQAEYHHQLLTNMQPKDKVSCPICDKVFDLKKYLDEHLKKHSGFARGMPTLWLKISVCSSLGIHIRLRHPGLDPTSKKKNNNNNLYICCV